MHDEREFDLLDPATIQDPYDLYRWLLAEAPVWKVPDSTLYLVSSWKRVTEAVARTEDFSSNLDLLLYTGDDGRPAMFDMTHLGANIRTLATADPPVHTAHRKVVFPKLVERQMTALEPTAREIAGRLLDRVLPAQCVEWTSAVAEPLPVVVLSDLMGFVDPDLDQLLGWALDGAGLLAGTGTLEQMALLSERAAESAAYLAKELDAAAPDPAAGIVGAVRRGVDDGALTPEEAVSTLVILLGAGGESTGALIGNAVRLLAEHHHLQDVLRADRSRIPVFVEEVLRFESPFRGHYRMARRDSDLGGATITSGSLVYLVWAAANRDPAEFENPDELRMDRPTPRGHIGFGRGIHFCVGAPLARMEARIAIDLLLDRTRRFTLDPDRPPTYVPSIFVRRHEHLDLLVEPV